MTNEFYTLYDWSSEYSPKDTFNARGYTMIASIDESEPYEVDQTAIFKRPDGGFAFATASGCSCWDGDWGVQDFDTLDDIEAARTSGALDSGYNPTNAGFTELMTQARQALDL